MYMRLKDGKSKVFTMSYDDGVVQDIRLSEIMKKNGLKGTFNVNSGLYCDENEARNVFDGRMKLSEAKKLYIGSGNEIAIHGYTHPYLEKLRNEDIIDEIVKDRLSVENNYGVIAKGMAYPFGTFNDTVLDALKLCGISYARTVNSTGKFDFPSDWLKLNPTCHHNSPNLMKFADTFIENEPKYHNVWMFYLWGHSYEFDQNDNWNVIEKFAEFIGQRKDVWYATNIEIYNYVRAYQSLQTSVDKSIIYNPSDIDIWVSLQDDVIKIPAGETVYLKNN